MTPRTIVTAALSPLVAAHRFDGLSLLQARGRFFTERGIPLDGGYDDAVVPIYFFGRLHIFDMPNTEGRKRAVRFHDLHHVLTGYQTDWRGEGRISAWEIATSCRDHWAAWFINPHGLLIGLLIDPVGTLRAFVRGRRSQNLYAEPWGPALLARPVEETQTGPGPRRAGRDARPGELLSFISWLGAALSLLALELAPVGLLGWGLLRVLG